MQGMPLEAGQAPIPGPLRIQGQSADLGRTQREERVKIRWETAATQGGDLEKFSVQVIMKNQTVMGM